MICDQHPELLCINDMQSAKRTAWPVLVMIIVTIGIFSTFFYFILYQWGILFSEIITADEGDEVTIESETVTITEAINFPDVGIIVGVFLLVAVPILIAITIFVRKQILKYQSTEITDDKETSKIKTFYCQQCGTQNTMEDMDCIACGKSTTDERRLVK